MVKCWQCKSDLTEEEKEELVYDDNRCFKCLDEEWKEEQKAFWREEGASV